MKEPLNRDYVCTNCLHEQATFTKPCEKCGSRKVEHSAFRPQTSGEYWRELREADKSAEH
jgi:hypothetical protein